MSTIMTPIDWQQCDEQQQQALLMRPAISASASISEVVRDVLAKVKVEGDGAR